tara:strand:- start:1348 stop:2040 length:693 start_codon:yes stop_codon:yes gene_type:complete
MTQTYVKFTLPENTYIAANDLREAVAKNLDGQLFKNKPALFNYSDEKTTLPGRPANRFIGGLGWLGFVSENDALLPSMVIAPAITHLLSEGVQVETYIGETEKLMSLTEEPQAYRFTSLIDQRDKVRGGGEGADELVKRHILSMFESALDEGVTSMPIDADDLEITVLESRRSGESMKFRTGGYRAVAKIRATFTMRANLSGIWQAGHLQSRGHGLIYSVNRGGFTQCPI